MEEPKMGDAKETKKKASAATKAAQPPEALMLKLCEICGFLSWSDQSAMTLVCKAFAEIMRARPDRDRAVNMVEVAEEWCKRNRIPSFCYARKDQAGIQVRYLSDVREFVDGISRLTSIYPLTYLSVDEVYLREGDLHSLPKSLVELKMQRCKVFVENLIPVDTVKVRKATLIETMCIVDGVPQSCAMAALFRHSLEELVVEREPSKGGQNEYACIWRICNLNKARKLQKLTLVEAKFPGKSLQHYLSLDLDSLYAERNDECRELRLPRLTYINLWRPDGDGIMFLRGCQNLEVAVVEAWDVDLSSYNTDYTHWCLTDLPKLKEIEVVKIDFGCPSYEASRVCISCERNDAGKVVRAHVEEIFLLSNLICLTETRCEMHEMWRWLYRDGFLAKDIEVSCLHMRSLGSVPSVSGPTDKLLTRTCSFDEVELHLNSDRGDICDDFHPTFDYVKSFVSKPASLQQRRLVLPIAWYKADTTSSEYENVRQTLGRMKLRSVAVVMHSFVDYDDNERFGSDYYAAYDFSWLEASHSSLEVFRMETKDSEYGLNWNRMGLESFTFLNYVSFKGLKLSKRDITMLGLLPALETLSLGECLLCPDDTDIVRLSSGTSGLFSTLRTLYLYTIDAKIRSENVGMDSDNGTDKFNEYNCLLTGRSLETVVLTEMSGRLYEEDEIKLIDPETWIRDCSLQNCVDLDLSGSRKLTSLEALDAPQLKRLVLNGCRELRSLNGIQRSPQLEILIAKLCPILSCTKSLKRLKKLKVVNFEGSLSLKLESFEFVKSARRLMYLNMLDCDSCFRPTLQGVASMFTPRPCKLVLDCSDFDALVGENGEGEENEQNVEFAPDTDQCDYKPFCEANERPDCPNSMAIKRDDL